MRLIFGLWLTLSFTVALAVAEPGGRNFERSLSSLSFDGVDYSQLERELISRRVAQREASAVERIRHNLPYLYHHKLNRQRFIVAPEPQNMVEVITAIFRSSNRIGDLVRQGRSLASRAESWPEMVDRIRQIEVESRELSERFDDYFVEAHASKYELKLVKSTEPADYFSSFLLSASRINQELDRRLDEYFLNDSPGAVGVAELSSTSIGTLTASLDKLAKLVAEEIRRLR